MKKKLYYKLVGLTHFIFYRIPTAFLSGFWQTIFKDEVKAFEIALAKEGFDLKWNYWGIDSASYTINYNERYGRDRYTRCNEIKSNFCDYDKIYMAYKNNWYYFTYEGYE